MCDSRPFCYYFVDFCVTLDLKQRKPVIFGHCGLCVQILNGRLLQQSFRIGCYLLNSDSIEIFCCVVSD